MKDLDIIIQIEKELNVELRRFKETPHYRNGYTLNKKSQIIGLSLIDVI